MSGRELAGAGVTAALFMALLAAAELWRRSARPPTEWTRKLVHVGGGVIALFLPWLVRSHWTVLALSLGFAAVLWLTRRAGLLASVHGVERRSEGGIYYPVAIYALFLLGRDRPAFYVVALLALVLSDALAALVGTTYGRRTYTVERHQRSVEGSLVFFLTTFLGAHLPLLLMTDLGRPASVLIAVQIALLVTLLEAISLRGNDNLIVPLATYYFLVKMTPHTAAFIGWQLLSQLLITAGVVLIARVFRFLTTGGALGVTLALYGAWALGGPEWCVAPAVGLALLLGVYAWLGGPDGAADAPAPVGRYPLRTVFYTLIVPTALYILNNGFETLLAVPPALRTGDPLYPLYLGALASHLAIVLAQWLEGAARTGRGPARPTAPALMAGLAGVLPAGLAAAPAGFAAWDAAIGAGVGIAGFALYGIARRAPRLPRHPLGELRAQAASVAVAVLAAAPAHLAVVL